jgi:Gram-negative bacterial TonB protein C-terminal
VFCFQEHFLQPVYSAPKEFNAVDAVRQWRYEPYVLDGLAVHVEMTITVNFDLTRRA